MTKCNQKITRSGNGFKENYQLYAWEYERGFIRTTAKEIKEKVERKELYYNNYLKSSYLRTELELELEQ